MGAHRVCRVCGRRFGWRRKWAKCWEQVRYCSAACRRRGVRAIDRRIEIELLELLDACPASGTVCPTEVARCINADGMHWHDLLESVRMAARRLRHAGELEILQSGRPVDPDTARGSLRLRRCRGAAQQRFRD
jgi:hypothetical protein